MHLEATDKKKEDPHAISSLSHWQMAWTYLKTALEDEAKQLIVHKPRTSQDRQVSRVYLFLYTDIGGSLAWPGATSAL